MAFFVRHAPFGSRGMFQHGAGSGTRFSHSVVEIAHGAGSIGILRTVLDVANSLNDGDSVPVRFQFIGNDHGQTGTAACTHFRTVSHDLNRAVGLDAKIDARLPQLGIAGCCSLLSKSVARQKRGADYQCTGRK